MRTSVPQSSDLIRVANLLRIAFYAGDLLDELEDCETARDEGRSFEVILQAMLARAGERVRLRGFERGYSVEAEVTSRPHGRVLIGRSLSGSTLATMRLACEYDDFASDTPHNRLLKACARVLVHCGDSSIHQDTLRALVREMREVADVRLSRSLLRMLPRSAGARRYRVVRFIARLLVDSGQPDENLGGEWARRLLQDEKKMRVVFEAFVRRWGKAHKPPNVAVGRTRLEWASGPQEFVGGLNTDVTVDGPGWTRIVECKYMRSAFTTHQHGRRMFHPEHLRQIFAYLSRASESRHDSHAMDGVLLYPSIGPGGAHRIELGSFRVMVQTAPLSAPWSELTGQLRCSLFYPRGDLA